MNAFVPALLVKVTLIFAAGLCLTAFMRRASSAMRHLVLLAALGCGLTLPLIMSISPRWDVALLSRPSSTPVAETQAAVVDDNALTTVDRVTALEPAARGSSNIEGGVAPSGVLRAASALTALAPI